MDMDLKAMRYYKKAEEKERKARRDKILIPIFTFLYVLMFALVWWFK